MSNASVTKENLALKAAQLARANPNTWREFLEAIDEYNSVFVGNLVNSPVNELPVNQGRAQSLSSLHSFLLNCVGTAEMIEKKRAQ